MIIAIVAAAVIVLVPAVLVLGSLAFAGLAVATLASTEGRDADRAAVIRPLPVPTR